MKPRDVQRGITSRNARSGGEAPDIGRVSRLHNPEILNGGQVQRRRSSRGNLASKKTLMIWSVALGAGAACVVIAAFFLWLKPLLRQAPVQAGPREFASDVEARVISRFPSPSREESIRIVREALANRDPEQVPVLFRAGSATAKEIIDFCADSESRDGTLGEMGWLSSVDTDGLLLEGVVVNYEGKEKPTQRLALLTPDVTGRWRLDFDAFARTVKPSWDALLKNGGKEGLVRVMIAPDVYYNGVFKDESEWVCYGMNSPDTELLLRGYCKAGSPQADELARWFSDGSKIVRATVEIRRIDGGENRQFEIVRILGHDWIVADPAAGEG